MTAHAPAPDGASPRLSPAYVVAGLVAAALIVAVVVVAVSQRGGEPAGADPSASADGAPSESASGAASADPSQSPSAAPSEEPEPTDTAVPRSIAWEDPAPFELGVTEVFVDGDRWILGGFMPDVGPAAYTSTDARTWEAAEVENQQPDETFAGPRLGPIVRLGDSLLSYGTFIGCCDGRGVYGWLSADGASWEAIASESPLFEHGYLVTELAVGDPALVAVEGQFSPFNGRIWRWTEEASWVETTPGAARDEPSGLEAEDVIWVEDRFVAVGARGDGSGRGAIAGASWVSSDGESWEESAPSPDLDDVHLLEVTVLPGGGLLALGITDAANAGANGVPVAFTSSDGLTWAASPAPTGEVDTHVVEVVAVEGGLVAVAHHAYAATTVWTSPDGVTWSEPVVLDGTPKAAAATSDVILIASTDSEADASGNVTILHRGTVDP